MYAVNDEKVKEVARFYISNKSTVRKTAKHFGISKSVVHVYLSRYLKDIDEELMSAANKILSNNKKERHIRGGLATKKMYRDKSKNLLKY